MVRKSKWSSPFKKGQKVLLIKNGIIANVTKINQSSQSINIETFDGKIAHIFDYQFAQIKAYNGPLLSQPIISEIVDLITNNISPEEISQVTGVPVSVVTEFTV